MLSNPIYLGRVRHKDQTYPGLHEAILTQDSWDAVQARLSNNKVTRSSRSNAAHVSLLAGKVFDEEGVQLTPSHTNRRGKRYRYYVSKHFVMESGEQKPGWRLPAAELESAVLMAVSTDRNVQLHFKERQPTKPDSKLVFSLIENVEIGPAQLRISMRLKNEPNADAVSIEAPFTQRRRGVEQKLVLSAGTQREPDVFLIRRILKAMDRVEKLKAGRSLKQIADEEDTTAEYLSKNLDLAFLSPKILKAIAAGQQDPSIAVSHFHSKRLPVKWADQDPIFL